jgi:anti-sigma regulatory factor (Ser/Thr protein kinase)
MFVDSTILTALVRPRKLTGQRGSRRRVQLGTASLVREVFEISNLLEALDCLSDRAESLGD